MKHAIALLIASALLAPAAFADDAAWLIHGRATAINTYNYSGTFPSFTEQTVTIRAIVGGEVRDLEILCSPGDPACTAAAWLGPCQKINYSSFSEDFDAGIFVAINGTACAPFNGGRCTEAVGEFLNGGRPRLISKAMRAGCQF